jgi:hypothetical protein
MNGFWCVGLIVMRCFAETSGGASVECPPLRTWPPAFQKQIAAELRAAPKNSAMARVVVNAIGDRDVIRACRHAISR